MRVLPRDAARPSAALALRPLPEAGARLPLVRPDPVAAAAAFGVVLLHQLPGLVDAARRPGGAGHG